MAIHQVTSTNSITAIMPAERQTLFVETSYGRLGVRSAGEGDLPALLLIHGNSSESRIFRPTIGLSKIFESRRVIALDLPGHGESSNAEDPDRTYTMPGYAKAAVEVLQKLDIKEVVVVGWSLGAHVGVEMIPLFPGMKGIMLVGALLVKLRDAPLDDERTRWNMRLDLTADDLTKFAKGGTGGPYEEWMADAAIRTDPKARRVLFTNLGCGDCSDQQKLIAETSVPTAVVVGTDEPHLDNSKIKALKYGSLWSGKVVELEGCQHCPLWEKPAEFVPVLKQFLEDVAS
jgi:pimeloyl-ACP methyl ester carboxylesterase